MLELTIEIFGIEITEPVTTVTDLIITAVALYSYFSLRNRTKGHGVSRMFLFFFAGLAFSSATGGLMGHGFSLYFKPDWLMLSWAFSVASMSFMSRAVILSTGQELNIKLKKGLLILNRLEMPVFIVLTVVFEDFIWVVAYSVYAMVLVSGSLNCYMYRITGQSGFRFINLGTLMGLIAAVIFIFKWQAGIYLNHADLGHLFTAMGVLFYYRGAVALSIENKVYGQGNT